MLKKKEEKQDKVKDEAYYAMKIQELRAKSKNLSLVVRNLREDKGTYRIWSLESDDEEMCHSTHTGV